MAGAKPLAALSAGLLARKGEARPAMRRAAGEDGAALGWNDLGDAPPVLEARARLAEAVAAMPAVSADKARAFTLRLDAERHLRLRLASAAHGRSAQQIVTQALDAFLATLPEVEALHARLSDTGTATVRGK